MACRSEPRPPSERFRTVNKSARAGAARTRRTSVRPAAERRFMVFPRRSAIEWNDIAAGAQTERRGDAWPVRVLLGGRDLTGRFVCGSEFSHHRSRGGVALDHNQNSLTTSPPARVTWAAKTRMSI